MAYEYNEKAHYAAHGKHEELITGKDLTQLEIVVRNRREFLTQTAGFDLRLEYLQVF